MSLRKNAIANFIGQGWGTLMGFAFIPLYIRFLGLEAYGLIGVFALLQTWLSLLDLGLTPAIGREMARFTGGGHDGQSIRDLLRSVEFVTTLVAVAVAASIWAVAGWLATEWLHVDQLTPTKVETALGIMGVVVGLRFIEGIYRNSAVGLQLQVQLNVVVTTIATIRSVGAVAVLALISSDVTAFFIWQAVVSAISVVTLMLLVYRALPSTRRRSKVSLAPLAGVWRFAAGTLLITFLGFVLSQFDKVILSALLSLSAFAVYSLAYSVASAVRLLAQPIDQAVLPRFTQLIQQSDEPGLAILYHKASQFNAVVMGGVGLFVAVFGDRLLLLWTQNPDIAARAYPVLATLVIGMVINGVMNTPYHLQLAAGWTSLLVRVNAAMVVFFVPTIYLLTLRFGMIGAAAAWVLLNIAYLLVVARLVHRRLLVGEFRSWYVEDVFAPLVVGAIAGLLVRPLATMDGPIWVEALALCLALTAILAAASLAANHVRGALVWQLRSALKLA
jgi:O-antigen/teichoic acid export membrane protein